MIKKMTPFLAAFAAALTMLVPSYAFAAAATYDDFSAIITAVTGQVSVSTVVGILTQAATISIGLVFMWWGVRKVSKVLFAAFRKGRFSV